MFTPNFPNEDINEIVSQQQIFAADKGCFLLGSVGVKIAINFSLLTCRLLTIEEVGMGDVWRTRDFEILIGLFLMKI